MALTSLPIQICMWDNTKMENLKVLVSINGQTVIHTLGNLLKARNMEKANGRNSPLIFHRKIITTNMMATTSTIKSMGMVNFFGNQATNTQAIITEMKDKDMEICIGQMVVSIKDIGSKEYNTESVS